MSSLKKLMAKKNGRSLEYKPRIFNLEKKNDRNNFQSLLSTSCIHDISDNYETQLKELFLINHPHLQSEEDRREEFSDYLNGYKKNCNITVAGKWIYFPWLFSAVHILNEEDFFAVRTARNKNLITNKEQERFYNSKIGIAGLSVGNSVALSLVLQGGAKNIHIADFDTLDLSNTNRIRTGVHNIGIPKTILTAREIYTINPYAQVEIFKEGITEKNVENFFTKNGNLDIVIDEVDSLSAKLIIREQSKKNKIPLLMAADNGDNIVLDIERYDNDDELKFFHGRMGDVTYGKLKKFSRLQIGRMIAKHIGVENIPLTMQESLIQVGKTLVSWPQLGGAALLNGVVIAYCVRRILNGQSLIDNRALLSLDELLIPDYNKKQSISERIDKTKIFKQLLDL